MAPKPAPKPPGKPANDPKKLGEPNKSIILVPSRIITRPDELEGGEETEIAAQISVPEEGRWGWVVVIASFWCLFVLDGIVYTFGSLLRDMTKDLAVEESMVTIINSLGAALYFMLSPLASALINRFGFRACLMTGSVIVSCAFVCTYFSTGYATVCVFYGVIAGFGFCLINLASSLVVGFYFEKLRALAITISCTGSSVGIMTMFPLNVYLVSLGGWRTTILLHSSLFGSLYFAGMAFRPLLSFTVVTDVDDPTRTVTYLPNLSAGAASRTAVEGLVPTATERLFSAVSNANFPTAASIVEETTTPTTTQPGPSTQAVSKLTLRAHSPQGGMSRRQLKQVQSIISRTSVQDKGKKNIEVDVNLEKGKRKRSCWARLCHWEQTVQESRPMYRDDAFYGGDVAKLEVYQKSMMDTTAETRTGLEYQLAVSRAVTTGDLKEKRGVFTTAVRRVLATMMDPKLLRRPSFLLMCAAGFTTYLGYLVPYVYLKSRNSEAGISDKHCTMFVTVIGLSNAVGRLIIGSLAVKINPIKLYGTACIVAGVSTILSELSYSLYYQYAYCIIFGGFISCLANLRSLIIVNLFGLDKLTNATGMILLFHGLGTLISTPLASVIKNNFGYTVSFYVAGGFLTVSGCLVLALGPVGAREKERILREEREKRAREAAAAAKSKLPRKMPA